MENCNQIKKKSNVGPWNTVGRVPLRGAPIPQDYDASPFNASLTYLFKPFD